MISMSCIVSLLDALEKQACHGVSVAGPAMGLLEKLKLQKGKTFLLAVFNEKGRHLSQKKSARMEATDLALHDRIMGVVLKTNGKGVCVLDPIL